MKKWLWSVLSLTLIVTALSFLMCGSCSAALQASQPQFPNADLLVSADSVQSTTGIVIIDARAPAAYTAGHIPGAMNIQHSDFWTAGKGLHSLAALNQQLGALGLSKEMTFVIYDNTTASWGAAGRLFWMLEYLGCKNVHILDGGWDKWVADSRTIVTTASPPLQAATFAGVKEPARKSTKSIIASQLNNDNYVVIDCRTDEEYLGWQLYGESRGGHIPGAVQIPYSWFFNKDKTVKDVGAISTIFLSRGVTKDKTITAHCTAGIRSGFAYFILRLMGYTQISNYDASIFEWSADATLPMEKANRYSTIVYPAWVKAVIDYQALGGTEHPAPPQYPYGRDHKFIIFHTSWDSTDADYTAGHIPGAIHMGTGDYEDGYPTYHLLSDSELHAKMGSFGITPDTTVIIYSDAPYDDGTPWGIGWSARMWWTLKYAGLEDVRILNGGYTDWIASGYTGESGSNAPAAASFSGSVRAELLATTDYVAKKRSKIVMGDVRKYDEFIGSSSGYPIIQARGRIPGAVWLADGGSSSYIYHDKDGTISSYTLARDFWLRKGLTKQDTVAFYCGGGYRSALALLHAYLMKWDKTRNYANGWIDWSTNFVADAALVGGLTPGYWQKPSDRPIVVSMPSE